MLARRHITSLPDPDLRAVLLALADTVDPSRWCPTIPQESALAGMESFLSTPGGGLGLLTGDHGTGKSLLVAMLAARAAGSGSTVAVIETGLLGFEDLLLELSSQLAGARHAASGGSGLYDRLALFKNTLVETVIQRGRQLTIFFDEADSIETQALARIASLSNLRSAGRDHVTSVLVGSGALPRKLAACPSAASRIGTAVHIEPLTSQQASQYVTDRLAAGSIDAGAVFETDALDRIHAIAGGAARRIDSVCRGASRAALPQRRRINLDDLAAASGALPDVVSDRSAVAFGR
jgi:general secretion pathway protein A